jgi:hypothetical protein
MSALAKLARKQLMSARLWQLTTVASLAAIPYTNYRTLNTAMQKIRIAAIDGRGSRYFFNAGTFEEATQKHLDYAEEACETIFNRSPLGLDFDPRVERMFNGSKRKDGTTCIDDVRKMVAADAEIFRQRNIHQVFEMGQIPGTKGGASEEMQCSDDVALVAVHGQIVRTGEFGGSTIPQSQYVTVFVQLVPNNDAIHNGKYEMVVSNFHVEYHQHETIATR